MLPGVPVLVVDDNALNLKLTKLLLEQAGFVVETASDAEQALSTLDRFKPRLILMDLQMPGMDGFELTRRIKQQPELRLVRVVALTAYAMKGDEQRAIDAGCDGYITKPVDTRMLVQQVRRFMDPDAVGSPRERF